MRVLYYEGLNKTVLIIAFLLLAGPAIASAACHVVLQGGSGNGSDWTRSLGSLPATLIRGDVYYIGKGTYPSYTFNTAESGSTVITVQAPTAGDHCTDTGFNAGTMVGQAVFTAPLTISKGYVTFNGSYRGTNWNDSTGYGFTVNNNNGSNLPISSPSIAVTSPADNVTFKYIDVNGSHNMSGPSCEFGLWFEFGPFANPYVGYSHIHDVGAGPNLLVDGTSFAVVEYNWIERDNYLSNCHSEGVAVRPEGGQTYVTVRYNYIENTPGTAPGVATPMSDGSNNTTWYIYGNVVFENPAESTGQPFGGGDGVIDLFGNATWNNAYIYNNTFANIIGGQAVSFGAGWATIINGANIQNNVWYNSGGSAYSCTPSAGGSCNGVVADHNTFTNTNNFSHVANAVGADDFHLSSDIGVWTPLADATLPNGFVETLSKDIDGVTRTTSQGAYQFVSGSAPAPPTGLAAIVH